MRLKKVYIVILLISVILISACSEKDFTNDSAESFKLAKKPYDKKNYELAIEKLSKFKTKFPYSQYAIEAELLIANSYFELGKYEEASAEYIQFIRLHPKHPELAFVMYRVGECFWKLTPKTIDREQEFTKKAIEEWEKLVKKFPDNEYTRKALELINIGKRRLAEHIRFIARFYCKQNIYYACLYRYLTLLDKYHQFTDIYEEARQKSIKILMMLAKTKEVDPQNDKNIYLNSMNAQQLRDLALKFEKLNK